MATLTHAYEGQLGLVLEYAPRGNLIDLFGREVIKWSLRMRMMLDVAHGMAFIHQNKMMHRDLKPENILVDETYRCKICDLGAATLWSATKRMTQQVGTMIYMVKLPYSPSILPHLVFLDTPFFKHRLLKSSALKPTAVRQHTVGASALLSPLPTPSFLLAHSTPAGCGGGC
eukprot:TRINITY_DN22411_c0_g2_i1.p1 TRINITY_DN22411_c0_g2~~TRINITY_DN22411_c0_g2_i1.p1  ORF type:complete len:172 (+),score=17.37 TRINITY_DN22411_c0_g2_i1:124-639(+)